MATVKELYETLKEASKAAVKLKITTWREYLVRRKEDPRLPGDPAKKYPEEWKGLRHFLGNMARKSYSNKYQTLAEATAAVQKLDIKSVPEYKRRYHEDPRLYSDPGKAYADWNGYNAYFGKAKPLEKYATLSEAAAAVQNLNIKTAQEYRTRYKEDPRLPVNPFRDYKNAWVSMPNFLRGVVSKYDTLEECRKVVNQFGICTYEQYIRLYKFDERLPSNPERFYSDEWRGNAHFFRGDNYLHSYSDILEASAAAISLKISTELEYSVRYTEDPKLPIAPQLRYESQWSDWNNFLQNECESTKKVSNAPGSQANQAEYYAHIDQATEAAVAAGFNCKTTYLKRYSEDPKLPMNPAKVYMGSWVSWPHFLKRTKKYRTLREWKLAVDALGIDNRAQYVLRSVEDAMLPVTPEQYYRNWTTWHAAFSGIDCYPSLVEASAAAQKLSTRTKGEYLKEYSKDPRLPQSPTLTYSKEWNELRFNWGRYLLGVDDLYSYKDAAIAVQRLHITSATDYSQRYSEDSKLPACPHVYYIAEWQSWKTFLLPAVCTSLDQVKQYVKVLGISNSTSYRKISKRYPGLPSTPEKRFEAEWTNWDDLCNIPRPYSYDELHDLIHVNGITTVTDYRSFKRKTKDSRIPFDPVAAYPDKWVSWYEFFGKEEPYNTSHIRNPYRPWADAIEEFIKVTKGGSAKERPLCKFVRHFIVAQNLSERPEVFLAQDTLDVTAFTLLMEQQGERGGQGGFLNALSQFAQHIIDERLTLVDDDTGEVSVAYGAKNPFLALEPTAEYQATKYGETIKPALTYGYVCNMRNWIIPHTASSYSDLTHLHVFDADWVEINPKLVDPTDPDCVVRKQSGVTKIWSPISWMHTYALASVPARGRQLAYNDSGEADKEVPEYLDGKIVWVKNSSPMAGMLHKQGFIKRYPNDEAGMHFTSNKSSVAHSGYDVAWVPPELARWMIKLRCWQAKYNPIKQPTPWLECTRTGLNEKQLKAKGANCFLFRDFGEVEVAYFTPRLASRLACALFHTQPKEIVLATCAGSLTSISTYSSNYTPHSMRVSLITAYVVEFGLDIHDVMKLAGHSSLVMSIYYVKIGTEHLREKFASGQKRALANSALAAMQMIEQGRVHEIRDRLIENFEDGPRAYEGECAPGSLLVRDYGFCPYAGARCDDGGPLIGNLKVRQPVPAGKLGSQNCLRCRHFVTGPAFLGGLLAVENDISLSVSIQSEQFQRLQASMKKTRVKIDELDVAAFLAEKNGEPFDKAETYSLSMKCRKTKSESEAAEEKLDSLLTDLQCATRLIRQSVAILNKGDNSSSNSNIQLIVQAGYELQFVVEEASKFNQYNEVCENAEIYESVTAENALANRSQWLDRMMALNNMYPRMSMLSDSQQLEVGNQMAAFIYSRLKSFDRVDHLMEGKITFHDLADDERISQVDIDKIFVANGLEQVSDKGAELMHSKAQKLLPNADDIEG